MTYALNFDEIEKLIPIKILNETFQKIAQNEIAFKSKPLKEQAIILTQLLSIKELLLIRLQIQDLIDPEKKLLHNYVYAVTEENFTVYNDWFLDSCKISKYATQKALEFVEKNLANILDFQLDDSAPSTRQVVRKIKDNACSVSARTNSNY